MGVALGGGAIVLIAVLAINFIPSMTGTEQIATSESTQCEVKPFREDEVANLIKDGAVIAYHRTAGTRCVDELYAVYPDGRVVGKDGEQEVEGRVDPADLERILTTVSDDYGWFTEKIYSTWHNPCGTCYAHYLTIYYQGQEKSVTAVDGGVDMQPEYGYTLSVIRPILPKFSSPLVDSPLRMGGSR
jgi:hypothetical protein